MKRNGQVISKKHVKLGRKLALWANAPKPTLLHAARIGRIASKLAAIQGFYTLHDIKVLTGVWDLPVSTRGKTDAEMIRILLQG